MRGSRRVEALPEYLSARLMRLTAEARARGEDVIALGIGDPDTTRVSNTFGRIGSTRSGINMRELQMSLKLVF